MGYQDYIGETEAASFTGVSMQTLTRFAEAGYLQIEFDGDGMRLFSRGELCEVFGMGGDKSNKGETKNSDGQTAPLAGLTSDDAGLSTSFNQTEESKDNSQKATARPKPVLNRYSKELSNNPPRSEVSPNEEERPQSLASESKNFGRVVPLSESIEIERISSDNESAQFSHSSTLLEASTNLHDQEISKLRTVISLQEKLLDSHEAEIKDLKEQRDWLRLRIEKFEEKGDRDQLLLLSETQVIRKLVSAQQKRSSLRAALEWLGIIEQAKQHSQHMIEVKSSN